MFCCLNIQQMHLLKLFKQQITERFHLSIVECRHPRIYLYIRQLWGLRCQLAVWTNGCQKKQLQLNSGDVCVSLALHVGVMATLKFFIFQKNMNMNIFYWVRWFRNGYITRTVLVWWSKRKKRRQRFVDTWREDRRDSYDNMTRSNMTTKGNRWKKKNSFNLYG